KAPAIEPENPGVPRGHALFEVRALRAIALAPGRGRWAVGTAAENDGERARRLLVCHVHHDMPANGFADEDGWLGGNLVHHFPARFRHVRDGQPGLRRWRFSV